MGKTRENQTTRISKRILRLGTVKKNELLFVNFYDFVEEYCSFYKWQVVNVTSLRETSCGCARNMPWWHVLSFLNSRQRKFIKYHLNNTSRGSCSGCGCGYACSCGYGWLWEFARAIGNHGGVSFRRKYFYSSQIKK